MNTQSEVMETLIKSLNNQHKDINIDASYHFLHVSSLFNIFLDAEFSKAGLNRTQIMILSFLLAKGGVMTPTEFQIVNFRSINAVSKSIDSLDKMGLTKSTRTKADRRKRKVRITEKGLEQLEKILAVRHDIFAKATKCLNKQQAEELRSLLIQLEEHLFGILGKTFDASYKSLVF